MSSTSMITLAGHAYLDRHNVKAILEEITTQLAVEMPEDPLAAIVKMIDQRRNNASGFFMVTCDNTWCGMKVASNDYEEHRKNCRADRWTKCIRCDQRVEMTRLHQHRMNCHLVSCPHCGECVLPRMLGLCPLQILTDAKQRRADHLKTKRAVEKKDPLSKPVDALQNSGSVELSTRSLTSTSAVFKGQGGPLRRLQDLWRKRHARGTFSALAFQAIWNIMETAREGRVALTDGHIGAEGTSITDRDRRGSTDQTSPKLPASGVVEKISAEYTEAFRQDVFQIINDRQVVEFPIAEKIVIDATKLLAIRPVVAYVQTPTDGEVVIVGDLHGQLKDLLHIVSLHGKPGPQKIFIFNGDFVDRGPYGVEILLYIYVLLCSYPNYVYLNRGNHEDLKTNCEYGFQEELLSKYDDDSKDLMDALVRSYKAMPLVTVIDKRVAVLHGGVPRHIVTLERIALIGKLKDVPTVEQLDEDEEIVCDILWSDPVERYKSRNLGMRHQGEFWRTSARGCGIEYLDGHTEAFLAHNNLEMIVRSHEMVAGGYELCHQGRCATVFSASDYCGVSGNRAAVMVFAAFRDEPVYQTWFIKDDVSDKLDLEASMKGEDEDEGFGGGADISVSFDEDAIAQQGPQATEIRSRVQEDCIQRIRERIWLKRYELLSTFCAVDTEQVGIVSKVEWCEVARKVLEQPDLPWYYLCQFLSAPVTYFREVPSIRYADFVSSVDSNAGKMFEIDWIRVTIKSVFGGMELPEDLRPATKEHERLARRRHSSMLESAGSSRSFPRGAQNTSKSNFQRSSSTVEVIAPFPPGSPQGKTNTARTKFHSPERGVNNAKPPATITEVATSEGSPLPPPLGGLTAVPPPIPNLHAFDGIPAATAESTQFAGGGELDNSRQNPSASSYEDVSGDNDEGKAFRFNFNYFVSILRAKSPFAAQLEDTDMYILFRFFDEDRDGHVVLGELMDNVAQYQHEHLDDKLSSSVNSDPESDYEGEEEEVVIVSGGSKSSSKNATPGVIGLSRIKSKKASVPMLDPLIGSALDFGRHRSGGSKSSSKNATPGVIGLSAFKSKKASVPMLDPLIGSALDFCIAKPGQGPVAKWIFPTIMQLQRYFLGERTRDLFRLFRTMDRDRDGYVNEADFSHAIKKMNRIVSHPVQEEQKQILFTAIAHGCAMVAAPSALPGGELVVEPISFGKYFSIHVVGAVDDEFAFAAGGKSMTMALEASVTMHGRDETTRSSFAAFLTASLQTPRVGGSVADSTTVSPMNRNPSSS
ncbi:serine-threonine protein phosphatase, putative [Bodo saltans]|uniref:Serine/threonine-protein phosphatase n=1 Tax=Bodo saltans TaxID=75058 RepID=A0A0S4JAH8_BODSA|nr:serine-threonine protein phosphatase, putative [Bodo saltans]|eukprot:CUG86128.1 serine-threonine protein phosphatase, putative [Bodo saltans]